MWDYGGVITSTHLAPSSITPRPLSCSLFPRSQSSFVSSRLHIFLSHCLTCFLDTFASSLISPPEWGVLKFLFKVACGSEPSSALTTAELPLGVFWLLFSFCQSEVAPAFFGRLIVLLTSAAVSNPEIIDCADFCIVYLSWARPAFLLLRLISLLHTCGLREGLSLTLPVLHKKIAWAL